MKSSSLVRVLVLSILASGGWRHGNADRIGDKVIGMANVDEAWIQACKDIAVSQRRMIDQAIRQLSDEEFFARSIAGSNSVANLLRHLGGNLKSRWTDFRTTDGEKPDRFREQEFADWEGDRQSLLAYFDEGWACLVAALDSLDARDAELFVEIRGERQSIQSAILRSLTHLSYHVGQLLLIARQAHQGEWRWLSIAPGKSEEHNQSTWGTAASRSAGGVEIDQNDSQSGDDLA